METQSVFSFFVDNNYNPIHIYIFCNYKYMVTFDGYDDSFILSHIRYFTLEW